MWGDTAPAAQRFKGTEGVPQPPCPGTPAPLMPPLDTGPDRAQRLLRLWRDGVHTAAGRLAHRPPLAWKSFLSETGRRTGGLNHEHGVKLHTLTGPTSAMIFFEDLNYGYFVFVLLITHPLNRTNLPPRRLGSGCVRLLEHANPGRAAAATRRPVPPASDEAVLRISPDLLLQHNQRGAAEPLPPWPRGPRDGRGRRGQEGTGPG